MCGRLFAILGFLLPVLCAAGNLPSALASALVADCPTAGAFCRTLLKPLDLYIGQIYRYEYKNNNTVTSTFGGGFATTLFSATSTVTETSAVTATVGRTTTTAQSCHDVVSCGPVTATGRQGLVRAACTQVVIAVSGSRTKTFTYPGPPTTYRYESTVTRTRYRVHTTTTFPVTTTTIDTKTEYDCTTVPPPAVSCHNQGIQHAYFHLTKEDQDKPPLKWNLTYYKTAEPESVSVYNIIGDYDTFESSKKRKKRSTNSKRSAASYNGCNDDYYISARAYIYAPQTGTYRFMIPAYNQAAFIWVGEAAYSGWNVSNALLKAYKPDHSTEGGPGISFHMEAGKYYALRSAFRCIAFQGFSYWFNIRRPDGFVMFGEYQRHGVFPDLDSSYTYRTGVHLVESDYIMRFGCGKDAKMAPKYPPYGQET